MNKATNKAYSTLGNLQRSFNVIIVFCQLMFGLIWNFQLHVVDIKSAEDQMVIPSGNNTCGVNT
jgi:hypothetical protein